jgi:hypothetical protein
LSYTRGKVRVENASKISIPKEFTSYRVKKVKIKNGNRKSANPVRLHIYSQGKDGLPDKKLLTDDILINKHITANDEIDLSHLDLVLSERVLFVGIEWIKPPNDWGFHHFTDISFGFTQEVFERLTYMRSLFDPKYRWVLSGLQHQAPDNLMVSLIID